MEFYLIRHTSVDVPPGVCYGQTDVPVTAATFEQEARHVRERLSAVTFEAAYCSPLSRTRRLARFCGFPRAVVDERLIEFNFGEWEMQPFDTLYATDPRFALWCDHYWTMRAPGGDCLQDQEARFAAFVREKSRQHHSPVAVFTHGGILAIARTWQGQSFSVPPYGSVVVFEPPFPTSE